MQKHLGIFTDTQGEDRRPHEDKREESSGAEGVRDALNKQFKNRNTYDFTSERATPFLLGCCGCRKVFDGRRVETQSNDGGHNYGVRHIASQMDRERAGGPCGVHQSGGKSESKIQGERIEREEM